MAGKYVQCWWQKSRMTSLRNERPRYSMWLSSSSSSESLRSKLFPLLLPLSPPSPPPPLLLLVGVDGDTVSVRRGFDCGVDDDDTVNAVIFFFSFKWLIDSLFWKAIWWRFSILFGSRSVQDNSLSKKKNKGRKNCPVERRRARLLLIFDRWSGPSRASLLFFEQYRWKKLTLSVSAADIFLVDNISDLCPILLLLCVNCSVSVSVPEEVWMELLSWSSASSEVTVKWSPLRWKCPNRDNQL